jgi:hypothetical protein
VCGVQLLRFFEIVLEDDDAARGLDRSTPVDELTGVGRDAQLVAGGAQRGDQGASPIARRKPWMVPQAAGAAVDGLLPAALDPLGRRKRPPGQWITSFHSPGTVQA